VLLSSTLSGAGATGLLIDVLPGGALAVLSSMEECTGSTGMPSPYIPDFSGLCDPLRSAGITVGVASAVIPLAIDLGTGALFQITPGEVFVEFE
jgi:hypothetical protein